MNLESIKIDKKDVVKVLYVPMTSMRRAVELLENPLHFQNDNCKRNLAVLQESKSLHQTEFKERNPRNIYRMALRQAIYSHRWNHLAYLLKKSPIWEQDRCHDLRVYIRALAILLMNHPTAKAQSLLQEYSHMVLALRTEPDKKALHKIILTLTQKLYSKAQKKSSHNAFEANF